MNTTRRMALSPCVLVAVAGTFVSLEDEPARRAQWIRQVLTLSGLPADAPWSAAFVTYAGYKSHQFGATGPSSWPIPRTGVVPELAAFALEREIAFAYPEPGDIALVWSRWARRYTRAGIVAGVRELSGGITEPTWACGVTAIEGNVTPHGGANGRGVYRVTRTITPRSRMMFVRWVRLDGFAAIGNPTRESAIELGHVVMRRCA